MIAREKLRFPVIFFNMAVHLVVTSFLTKKNQYLTQVNSRSQLNYRNPYIAIHNNPTGKKKNINIININNGLKIFVS